MQGLKKQKKNYTVQLLVNESYILECAIYPIDVKKMIWERPGNQIQKLKVFYKFINKTVSQIECFCTAHSLI